MSTDHQTTLALLLTPNVGVVAVNRIMAMAASRGLALHELMQWSPTDIQKAFGESLLVHHLATAAGDCERRAAMQLERVSASGARVLVSSDADYPACLVQCLAGVAPPLLFARGDATLLQSDAVAVVGARAVSVIGMKIAQRTSVALANEGAIIVSGGAEGVDMAAHMACLTAGGRTVMVLPQGILTYTPSKPLQEAIDAGRACIVSEFAPDLGWQTHAAVTRNATISALARMVCVIEPKKIGGSIRTARCALEQGKRVLIFTQPKDRRIVAMLGPTGVYQLMDESGLFRQDRIVDLWKSAPSPQARQPDLSDEPALMQDDNESLG